MVKQALLPTPTKGDSKLSGGRQQGAADGRMHSGTTLSDLVQGRTMAPTPTKRDWRSTRASPATMAANSRPLSEWTGSTLGLHGTAAVLAISSWLQGLSPDWLARSLQQSETLSCPRSPKRSGGR